MNLFSEQQRRCKHKEQNLGHGGGSRWWDNLREYHEAYTLPHVK